MYAKKYFTTSVLDPKSLETIGPDSHLEPMLVKGLKHWVKLSDNLRIYFLTYVTSFHSCLNISIILITCFGKYFPLDKKIISSGKTFISGQLF